MDTCVGLERLMSPVTSDYIYIVRMIIMRNVNRHLLSSVLDTMGYEIGRFEGDVDEELICPICSGVMEEPLQVLS